MKFPASTRFDAKRQDRKQIIKVTEESLKSSGQNLYSWFTEDKIYSTGQNINIEYYETEKFIMLATAKGGHSYITALTNQNNLLVNDRVFLNDSIKKYGDFINIPPIPFVDGIPDEIQEYYNILNGKSKKDIIIVTRNPIAKWMSGTIQDMDAIIDDSPIIKEFLFYKKDVDKRQEILNMQLSLIPKYLQHLYNESGTLLHGHAKLYNEYFYQLIQLNNIDKNKLYIVDIDNPEHDLYLVFKKYFPEIPNNDTTENYWTHRLKFGQLFQNLKLTLTEAKVPRIVATTLEKELDRDYQWYKILLQKYKDNIWKP
jgi:hypothetical protein